MSIDLQNAKEKLNVLENIEKTPELIFTNLFDEGLKSSNFLYQVNVEGRYISDYLVANLYSLPVFENTILKLQGYELEVKIAGLKAPFENLQTVDQILEIDLYKKTYKLCDTAIQRYSNILSTVYKLDTLVLSDFFKKYENLTIKKRIRNAFLSLYTNKKWHIKISDFIFALIVSQKKVEKVIYEEKQRINRENDNRKRIYENQIDLQNFYIEHAPRQILLIYTRQNEIVRFLDLLGYQENGTVKEQ